MKKFLYILSFLIIASMILIACGGGTAPSQAPEATEEAAPAPAEQAAPMSGDSMAKPEDSNGDAGKDSNSGD